MSKQELQAKFSSLKQENTVLNQANKGLQEELEYKDFVIAKLQRMLFGSTSEKFTEEEFSNQMSLFNDLAGQQIAADEKVEKEEITYQRNKAKSTKKTGGRIPLPEHLPRIEITIEPDQDITGMVKINEETTEILDIIPPKFQVIRIIRPIYAKPKAEQEIGKSPIFIADLPSRPIDKGIPSARLLAYLLVSKFVDHLPYYRQVKMLKVKKSGKKGKAHTGYYWVYYDPIDNQVVFIFDPGRGRKYPVEHLKHFSGKLQTDGLDVYSEFDKLDTITLFGCMAHVRRKFFDALKNDEAKATKVLGMIQQLYKIEEEARKEKYTPIQRFELRQLKATPIMTELKTYLDQEYDSKQVLPKSAIGIAIKYAIGQWWKIERYLTDGTVEIDNNLVENAIRPVAVGRKNYLFAGSEQGAKWGAMVYTFLASASRHGHNPMEYLADVLRRLPDTKKSQLHELFPANWSPRPASDLDLI